MSIDFINNYPINGVESHIKKKDDTPLYGEIWVYKQFIAFQENNFVDKKWYLKHNYNLSLHPASKGKVEGQIDFLLLNENGLLVIEVKGGGIRVSNDSYISFTREGEEYEAQNPFIQVKEYANSLKELIGRTNLFVYKAVVFPHEAGFELVGPQLMGYKHCFFSKKSYLSLSSDFAVNKAFYNFINDLGRTSRQKILTELNTNMSSQRINEIVWDKYPKLSSEEINRYKKELFPNQQSYGYNPDRINDEIILKENYGILRGLWKNNRIIVHGKPGSGKTVFAQKFIAENLLLQQKGILFCANKLVKSKIQHILIKEYNLDQNFIDFFTFSNNSTQIIDKQSELDFVVFDEAQEYFDNGLYDFIENINRKFSHPRILILYDTYQTIKSDYKEILFYEDFFIQSGYAHYHFDENFRCVQSKFIYEISECIRNGLFKNIESSYSKYLSSINRLADAIKQLQAFMDDPRFTSNEKVVLVDSTIEDEFRMFTTNYFKKEVEELSEENINVFSQKIRFTTPIKYRGLENKHILVLTKALSDKTKTQLYIGVTRAIEDIKICLWQM